MMPNHTPAPWTVFRSADKTQYLGIEGDNESTSIVLFGTGKYGDECGVQGRTREEAEANAHLMAVAPDMLAALKLVIDNCGNPNCKTCRTVRAVVDKAEGRQS